jgi:hypothetical protein
MQTVALAYTRHNFKTRREEKSPGQASGNNNCLTVFAAWVKRGMGERAKERPAI